MAPKKTPTKSPVKKRAVSPSPVAKRTTPRRDIKPPARLGAGDNWGSTTPTKWVSDVVTTQKEKAEDMYKERLDFVTKLNSESKGKSVGPVILDFGGMYSSYKKLMTKYTWPASIVQSVVLTVLGYVISQFIKAKPIVAEDAVPWAGWGTSSQSTNPIAVARTPERGGPPIHPDTVARVCVAYRRDHRCDEPAVPEVSLRGQV